MSICQRVNKKESPKTPDNQHTDLISCVGTMPPQYTILKNGDRVVFPKVIYMNLASCAKQSA